MLMGLRVHHPMLHYPICVRQMNLLGHPLDAGSREWLGYIHVDLKEALG